MLKKSFAAVAAIALLAGSSAAAAQSAQPLSLGDARTGASLESESELGSRRGAGIYIIGAIALALIIYGIIELTKDDEPESP